MAQYKYDKDGNYTGKILSESEHRDNRSSITPTKKCFFCGSSIYGRTLYGGKDICSTCNKKPKKVKDKKIKRSKEGFRILWIRSIILFAILFATEKYGITNLDWFGDLSGWTLFLIVIVWLFTCLLPSISRSTGIPILIPEKEDSPG